MPRRRSQDIVYRWEGNPVITIDDLDFQCGDIRNAGAVKFDEEYLLLMTVQRLDGRYAMCRARSLDGFHFDVDDKPFWRPSREEPYAVYEEMGVMDPRIVAMDGRYYIFYTALGHHGFRLGLAQTTDFESIERLGLVSEPDVKCGTLLPVKIKNKYARLDRPKDAHAIWITYSDDLRYWGRSEVIMGPRGGYWDSDRIGVAAPPIEIDEGWLLIYYGIKKTSAGPLCRLGAAILDRDDPVKVVGRTNAPILAPRMVYERIGEVPNFVYSCGAVVEDDLQVKLYYGAANSCICLGSARIEDIVEVCMQTEREF